MGRFDVVVGPVGEARFQAFLPDRPLFQELLEGIVYYVDQPLGWSLRITISPPEIRTACLGEEETAKLGWNAWLSIEGPHRESEIALWPLPPLDATTP